MFGSAKLKDCAPGEGVAAGASAERFDTSGWIDVPVPGDVHRALMAAGHLEDPFYDRNEKKCAWMEEREWWYRLSFDGPPEPPGPDERLLLIFHGLDTFATIWLNGEELGRHRNMFREAVFDVGGRVRPGEPNTLALCFERPLDHAGEPVPDQWGRNPERVAMRKAQFGFGWDWGPRLPTIGIWRPVELRRERRAAIRGVHFSTLEIESTGKQAVVAVHIEAERFATDGPLNSTITLASDGRRVAEHDFALDGDGSFLSSTAYLVVDEPRLWWTHDLGEPALCDLRVTLGQDGMELARHAMNVGIRTIALDQSPDPAERGTRFFRFVLNWVPIFARGADWIPADSFVGAIPEERYEKLLGAARDANMNMLRVWGGGIYEHECFYDLCDRLGLLVWQDFMFACAAYPERPPEFVAEVEGEARYQVRRLRSRPCLALWCGNNENQWIHDRVHWQEPANEVPGALYYHEILPRVVEELDGKTPYWPGSPFGGNDHNSREEGNVHNWEVWHGNFPRRFGEEPRQESTPETVSYSRYAEDTGRFISEFGMHASPVYETLRRAIPKEQLHYHSPSMDHHNKDDPKNKGDNLMLAVTGLPKDLDEYVDFSMIAQAEGLKFGIEHFRRRKPHCSGTLFWQLNDCWPCLSWSVLDYYGFGKAGYYYVRRAYAPILGSFKVLEDGSVELWITNDTLSRVQDNVTVRLGTFAGEPLWEETLHVRVAANSSRPIRRWEKSRVGGGADRYLSVRSTGDLFPPNRTFFAPIKDLRRVPVEPEAAITPGAGGELRVDLQTAGYAYFVRLSVPDEAAHLSDNYFDLEPGARRTVVVTSERGNLTPGMVAVGWR
ncbi:MAG: glycoside hydrolase family 2 protein [Actinomycetota bacterium]|nr:glycoside hydrolase family 2 protein [Actinomycetota bacterium]